MKEKTNEIYEHLKSQAGELMAFAARLGWFMNFQHRCGYQNHKSTRQERIS